MQFGWSSLEFCRMSTGCLLEVCWRSAGWLLDVYWGLYWTWEGDLGQRGPGNHVTHRVVG